MKSPSDPPIDGRIEAEPRRPMSCRNTDMQRDIAAAVRRACPAELQAGNRQSWRAKAVIAGDQPACPTLEAVIDERIMAGASAEDVMEIGWTVVRHVRAKLIARRPDYAALVTSVDAAYIHEENVQGPVNVAQMRVLSKRNPSLLRHAWQLLTRQRDATDLAIVATERAMQEHEEQHAVARQRFGLAGKGRAS